MTLEIYIQVVLYGTKKMDCVCVTLRVTDHTGSWITRAVEIRRVGFDRLFDILPRNHSTDIME